MTDLPDSVLLTRFVEQQRRYEHLADPIVKELWKRNGGYNG